MNILFIAPSPMPYHEADNWLLKKSIKRIPQIAINLGVIELSSYLRDNVDSVSIKILDVARDLAVVIDIYDGYAKKSYYEFLNDEINSVEFKPDIVGVSIMFSTSYKSALCLIDLAKQRWSGASIICGGNNATNDYRKLLNNKNVDYVVRGEAEISFTKLVNNMMLGKNEDIKGVIDRNKIVPQPSDNKSLTKTNVRKKNEIPILTKTNARKKNEIPASSWRWQLSELIEDLDEVPVPAYDLLDISFYTSKGSAYIMSSRGCVYNCSFCATKTVHGMGMRYKSKKGFYKSIEYLVGLGFKRINIQDDMVGVHKDIFFDMIDVLHEFKGKAKYLFPNGLNIKYNNEKTIDAFLSIGIETLIFSIESGSEYTMQNMVKKGAGVDLIKTKRLFRYIREKNKSAFANFIIGFPYETKDLMNETIDYIMSLDMDWCYINSALPIPGTKMLTDFVEMGVIDEKYFDFDNLRHGKRTFDTPEILAEDLENLVYDANIERNFFNNCNYRDGLYEKAISVWNQIIINPYPFHIVGKYCRAMAKLKLGKIDEYNDDLNDAIFWIESNEVSKWLFERYRKKMPELDLLWLSRESPVEQTVTR